MLCFVIDRTAWMIFFFFFFCMTASLYSYSPCARLCTTFSKHGSCHFMNGEKQVEYLFCSIGGVVVDKAEDRSIIHAALYGVKSGDDSRCNVMLCMDTDSSFRLF